MEYEEAMEWLKGKRSMCDSIPGNDSEWFVRTAQADAAMMQQAYWVAKYHDERRVK